MNVSPNILAKNWNFQKTETRFCRWKTNDYNNINIFLSLESPCTFLLAKKVPESAFLTATVNYRKILQKNKLCHSKQHQIDCLMICYLVFVFFIEKLWSQKGTPTCSDNNLRWQSTRTIWHASFSCSIRFEVAVLPYYRRPFTDYNYKIKVLFKNGCVMMYVNRFSRRAYQWHMRRKHVLVWYCIVIHDSER